MGVSDITKLIDDQVDRTSLLQAMDRLIERTRPGDFVILTIAGHGSQEPERVKRSQPDGLDKVFLLPGFNPKTAEGEFSDATDVEVWRFITRRLQILHGGDGF